MKVDVINRHYAIARWVSFALCFAQLIKARMAPESIRTYSTQWHPNRGSCQFWTIQLHFIALNALNAFDGM